MTVALACICNDGAIIASDEEESVDATGSKTAINKILTIDLGRYSFAIAGAGSSDLIEQFRQMVAKRFMAVDFQNSDWETVEGILGDCASEMFEANIAPFHRFNASSIPELSAIVSLALPTGLRVYVVNPPKNIIWIQPHHCFWVIGSGYPTAQGILRRIHNRVMSMDETADLAAYAVHHAKLVRQGVGGNTALLMHATDGKFAEPQTGYNDQIQSWFKSVDALMGKALWSAMQSDKESLANTLKAVMDFAGNHKPPRNAKVYEPG